MFLFSRVARRTIKRVQLVQKIGRANLYINEAMRGHEKNYKPNPNKNK